jgi:hypothetical protein
LLLFEPDEVLRVGLNEGGGLLLGFLVSLGVGSASVRGGLVEEVDVVIEEVVDVSSSSPVSCAMISASVGGSTVVVSTFPLPLPLLLLLLPLLLPLPLFPPPKMLPIEEMLKNCRLTFRGK